MKHIFILNGNRKADAFINTINDVMKGMDYEIVHTTSKDDNVTSKYINESNRIYCVGGDGLLNQVIQGMVNTNNELVLIPYGTGNDFHRYLSKEKDPRKVLINSLKLSSKPIDIALLNDRYYINTACFGLDSVIANNVHKGIKIPLISENKSYIISVIREIFKYKYRSITISINNKVIYKDKMILCTINNGSYYGGGFLATPKAKLDDGYLDIFVVDHMCPLKIPYMLILLITKKLSNQKQIHRYLANTIDIDCNYSVNIDGDELKYDNYHIEVIPKSIHLVY